MEQKPSIGRIVHYQPSDLIDPQAAIITAVQTDTVNLAAFLPAGGIVSQTSVAFDSDGRPGTWRWPPRT